MKKILLVILFLNFIFIVAILTSCQRKKVPQTNQSPAAETPTQPTPPGFFTTTASTPNGEFLLNCWDWGQLTCALQYPNGNQVPYGISSDGSGIWWSYDNQYAVICEGMTHDSPGCLKGFRMWRMIDGERIDFRIYDNGRGAPPYSGYKYQWTQFTVFKWKQGENQLAYYYQPDYANRLDGLVLFDAETSTATFVKECPEWLFLPTRETGESTPNLDWGAVCDIV
ncbi:MAG: hypothetical protein WAM60_15555, partial [Candidatus Promineifilaceae bacterium]